MKNVYHLSKMALLLKKAARAKMMSRSFYVSTSKRSAENYVKLMNSFHRQATVGDMEVLGVLYEHALDGADLKADREVARLRSNNYSS